jgi:hypothetical protein
MRRTLLMGIAIVAGATATLGSAYVGWSILRSGVSLGEGLAARRQSSGGKVEVNFRVIRYREPGCYLELTWEPIDGSPPIAYVPSPRRWRAEMPECARDRRSDIFPEIQDQTRFMNFTWQEVD